MPLDGGVPDPPNLTLELTKQKACERRFLEQLFNPKSIEDYKIPVPIQAELRSYQQVGHFFHGLRLNDVRKCFDRFTSFTNYVNNCSTVVPLYPRVIRFETYCG
jgi:hypothetical protein